MFSCVLTALALVLALSMAGILAYAVISDWKADLEEEVRRKVRREADDG